MELSNLLKESLIELIERPSYFLPKLLTSLIGSVWMLGILFAIGDPLTAQQDLTSLYLGLATFPIIFFLGVLSPVIVAEMVKNKLDVIQATKKCLSYTPRLISASGYLIAIFTAAILPFYLGLFLLIISGSYLALMTGTLVSLILIILLSYSIYFLPITLTDNSAVTGLRKSFNTSKNNSREASILVIVSFVLLILAWASSGVMRGLGITGFILGRLISSAMTTYTIIVSPKYYLEKE